MKHEKVNIVFKKKNKTGEFIKKLRDEQKLSQYELAEMIPIGREAISKWERGKTKPSKQCVNRLSEIFKVSIEEILSGERAKNYKSLLFDLYNEKNKLQQIIKILFLNIFILSFIILIYITINTYNSIKVYTINCDENGVLITNGIFVTTKDKLYFNLGNIQNFENIVNLKLYYKNNKLIYGTDDNSIILFDYYGYDEFFDSDNINDIVNNLYLEVSFKESKEIKKVKLNLKKDFSNNYKYIFNKKKVYGIEKNNFNKEGFNINDLKIKLKDNKYNDYFITILEDANMINVLHNKKEDKIEWNYNYINDFLEVNVYKNEILINSFYKNKNVINCNINNCDKNERLINEFYNLISEISN